MSCVIDIDRPDTWPAEVRGETERMAELLVGTTRYAGDLELPDGYDDEFGGLLSGHRLRAYHATRLLPHEIEEVRQGGLKLLTPELLNRRFHGLRAAGLVTEEHCDELRARTVFALNKSRNRENQICLFLGDETFSDEAGLHRLLETWGGEAIFWGAEADPALLGRLRSVGQPAIVVAQLADLGTGWRTHRVWPALPKHFIAEVLDLDNRGADVIYRSSIPGDRIEDVWLSGHPEFDRRLHWVGR